jgi:hypothetical protein
MPNNISMKLQPTIFENENFGQVIVCLSPLWLPAE